MKVAPHNVSGRRSEDFNWVSSLSLEDDRGAFAASNPVGLQRLYRLGPIQIRRSRNNSSAYFVALKNHCSRFFLMTGVPHRSQ